MRAGPVTRWLLRVVALFVIIEKQAPARTGAELLRRARRRSQSGVASLFVAGWLLLTAGISWAGGWPWLWLVSLGVLLMGTAGLTLWLLVLEERGSDRA